jgi:hypothetical protein
MILHLASQREHVAMPIDNARFGRPQRSRAGKLRLPRLRGRCADKLQPLDAIALAGRVNRLDLFNLTLRRCNDQLAILAIGATALVKIRIQLPPAGNAQPLPQASRRIVHPGVDHLGVARRDPRANRGDSFEHHHIRARAREGGSDRQPDRACSHDHNVNVH